MKHRPIKQRTVSLKFVFPFVVMIVILICAAVYFFLGYNSSQQQLSSLDITKYEATIGPDDVWELDLQLFGKSITELNEEEIVEKTYNAPNGLSIISMSEKWNSSRLKEIYDELLNNIHGNEMDYLNKIVLQPKGVTEDEDQTAGEYEQERMSIMAAIAFNPLIDSRYIKVASSGFGKISLYHMDDIVEIKEIASTLSHEYGHHFAHQYLFSGDHEDREESPYYRIRGLALYPDAKSYEDPDEYYQMHAWDIDEIAAEDYMQLLGSPTSKEIGEYMDVKEALYSENREWVGSTEMYHYNVFAQENPVIPMAEQVKGLEAYFHSFIDEGYAERYTEYGSIVISAEKKRSNGKTHYMLTWNELEPTDSEVIYTMVCFNEDGSFYGGIKTVSGDEALETVVGTPTRKLGSWLYWWDDTTMEEDRIFRVFAYIVDEEIMIGSEPFYADF